jgi:hypothetical protein
VPLHVHGYPEAFCLLEGELEFQGGAEKERFWAAWQVTLSWLALKSSMLSSTEVRAKPGFSASPLPRSFFDAIVATDSDRPFASMPAEEIFTRVAAIGARTDTRFVPGS